ncbi:MAG TPA: hypothetical protein VFW29_06840 [Solirubrobacteraceae bacterium]|nr:hypothetical protein [Solirubrobacteraceae bacterium]
MALTVAWLLYEPRTPDLAAAVYRTNLFSQSGFAIWDSRWYGGHDLPGYSLLFGPLASLLGVRVLGALCVLASTVLFERVVRLVYGPRARWGAVLFALAAAGDLWIGRISFALGVPLALAAVLALMRTRLLLAACAALLCAAASPVAGALLALAGASHALTARAPRSLIALVLPPAAVVLALVALFPEGGYEPFPLLSFLATLAVVVGFLAALPADERLLRTAGALYLPMCVACVAIHTPVGSNVQRYAVLLAAPLLACAWLPQARTRPEAHASRARPTSAWRAALAGAALCGSLVWTAWGPVRETAAVAGSAGTSAAYYAPLVGFLARAAPAPVRVEVPLTRSHWEAALLAPHVSLARGWEKQLDERYDGVLLRSGLDASSYRAWLLANAVAYVALPDVRLDPSSAAEGRLVAAGLPYLREVFTSAHWRVYSVVGATPLASGPAALTSLGHDRFALAARAPGEVVVRVRYSRYLALTRGSGCVSEAPGGWTRVRLDAAGAAAVAARFSLARAFASGPACTSGA